MYFLVSALPSFTRTIIIKQLNIMATKSKTTRKIKKMMMTKKIRKIKKTRKIKRRKRNRIRKMMTKRKKNAIRKTTKMKRRKTKTEVVKNPGQMSAVEKKAEVLKV